MVEELNITPLPHPKPLDYEQARLISLYSGLTCITASAMHREMEKVFGHPVYTHQMDSAKLWIDLRVIVASQFLRMIGATEGQIKDAELAYTMDFRRLHTEHNLNAEQAVESLQKLAGDKPVIVVQPK